MEWRGSEGIALHQTVMIVCRNVMVHIGSLWCISDRYKAYKFVMVAYRFVMAYIGLLWLRSPTYNEMI